MIAVIDYGMGNLRSVSKALERVGAEVRVTSDAAEIAAADGVVLPGVGAFARSVQNLESAGLKSAVYKAVDSGRPFLGICVGMQILFEESDEFGRVEGLGILPGRVRRFEPSDHELKVPHMGWNQLRFCRRPPHFCGIEEGERFYFVHSYFVETADDGIVAARTCYGEDFVSCAWRDNLVATQFHPEKSQSLGLRVLENFRRLVDGEEPVDTQGAAAAGRPRGGS